MDLGAGNGILGIGALLLGAPRAIFVEVPRLQRRDGDRSSDLIPQDKQRDSDVSESSNELE